MALAPTLDSVKSLFRKLERESYRAYHSQDKVHKADHFFNFCVTAHSLRDYLLEHLRKITPQDKKPFFDQWAAYPLLVAVGEIANSSKHFCLRDGKTGMPKVVKTKRVVHKKSKFADIYSNAEGHVWAVEAIKNDISVTLSDGTRFELYLFMQEVHDYWKSTLRSHGLRISRQSLARLQGT